jgi:hypothetical protein
VTEAWSDASGPILVLAAREKPGHHCGALLTQELAQVA